MKRWSQWVLAGVLASAATAAWGTFHTFQIEQIFTNADGTIQYVVLHESMGMNGENLLAGLPLTATSGMTTNTYSFVKDLPGGTCGYYSCTPSPTANRRVLIATQGFKALNLVTPDYVVPNGFIPLSNGTINYAGVDQVTYTTLPIDGVSALMRTGAVVPNLATNFAGASASVSAPAANYGGLWWRAPGGSEDGWGINFAHQGDVIFGTWFTYDTTGKGWWLTLITNDKSAPPVYQADLSVTTGPPFNAPFGSAPVTVLTVGEATLTFSDVNNGTFHYDVNLPSGTVSQTKAITRQPLGAMPFATCTFGAQPLAAATNYQDIWWAGTSANPGTESGWGMNFTHQGDIVFASWFTYDLDGTPLWLVAAANKDTPGVYSGDNQLYRPSGPRFDAYDKSQYSANPSVGSIKLTFADGNNAAFEYTVKLASMANSVTQSKAITRQVFTLPGTTCK